MEKKGIIRQVDNYGRIVIPIAIREAFFGTKDAEGKEIEIFCKQDGTIILKPHRDKE